MAPEQLAAEIAATAALTDRPFGVNLIIMHPQLDELVDVCLDQRVGHVVLAGGLPPRAAMPAAQGRRRQGRLLRAGAGARASKLVRSGADALVIEGMEAGGHIGPVSTAVLAQEILPHLREVPVFVAGGIGRGEAIAAYLRDGRGRRAARHRASSAPTNRSPIRASSRPSSAPRRATPCRRCSSTRAFPVIPVRALANPATEPLRRDAARGDRPLRRAAS